MKIGHKLVISLLFIGSIPIFPMATLGNTIKKFTPQAAYWALISAPFLKHIYSRYAAAKAKLPEASPLLSNFVQKELQKAGVTKNVPVRMDKQYEEGSGGTNGTSLHLGYKKDGFSYLEELLDERENLEKQNIELAHNQSNEIEKRIAAIDQELCWYRAMIQHEAGHIIHHDNERCIALDLAAPFALHGIITAAEKLGIKHLAAKTAIGIGALFAINGALKAYSKYREFCADDNIKNDPQLLRAAIEHFKQHEKDKSAEFLRLNTGTSYEELQRPPYSWFYALHHKEHPIPLKRVARFEKRLAKLEKQ